LKERIKSSYQLWLDSKRTLLQQDANEGTHLASTKCGNILAPTNENIRDWFTKAILEESPQRIINAFISCGITYGIHELVHLNKQLEENWNLLLEQIEESSDDNPYLDSTEVQLKVTINEGDDIITKEDEDEDEERREEEENNQKFRNMEDGEVNNLLRKEEVLKEPEERKKEQNGVSKLAEELKGNEDLELTIFDIDADIRIEEEKKKRNKENQVINKEKLTKVKGTQLKQHQIKISNFFQKERLGS